MNLFKHLGGTVLLLVFLGAQVLPAHAQRGSEGGRFALELSAGVLGIDNFELTEFAFNFTPKIILPQCWVIDPPPRWCFEIEIPIIVKPFPNPDPWNDIIFGPDQSPWEVPLNRLEVGPAVYFAPDLAVTFSPRSRVRPSFFAGGGLAYEAGRDTNIDGLGTFSTSSTTSPLITYGVGLGFDLTSRDRSPGSVLFKVEARALTVFSSDMDVETPDGRTVTFGGGTMTSQNVTAGFEFRF